MSLLTFLAALLRLDAPRPVSASVVAPAAVPAPATARPLGSKAQAAKLARGYRNRNPGNIDWLSPGRAWNGQIGREEGGRFGIYDTHENGIRAIGRQLRVYQDRHGLNTIREIIDRWAPPVENATNAYVARVDAAMLRHGADDRLVLSGFADLRELVEAIIVVELGGQPYDAATIDAGVRAALA